MTESVFVKAAAWTPPVVVGGVGGSGTRVVVQILMSLGVFMGDRLNDSNDAMRYAGYSGEIQQRLRTAALASGKAGDRADYAFEFAEPTLSLVETQVRGFADDTWQAYLAQSALRAGWGWKVPGMFHLLRPLSAVLGSFKYIHVIRHGVDMAFSDNQNQVANWGWRFGLEASVPPTPAQSLRYWTRANRQAVIDAQRYGADLLLLNFDQLCAAPSDEITRLVDFLGVTSAPSEALAQLVRAPGSIGRRLKFDLGFVGDEDRDALKQFGFSL